MREGFSLAEFGGTVPQVGDVFLTGREQWRVLSRTFNPEQLGCILFCEIVA